MLADHAIELHILLLLLFFDGLQYLLIDDVKPLVIALVDDFDLLVTELLVELLGGSISAECDLGSGCCFKDVLPAGTA